MDLEAEIDRLYSFPFGEFVAARNALAKALRAKGEREQAENVKSLAKPNLPAWAVNQLWHGERAAFDRLLDAGAAVREASLGKGAGGPPATAKKREAAKALLTLANKLLSAAGHLNTSSTQQRISHTLDAAMALGAERIDPPLGRLTRDLEPQGFDALAGLQLVAPQAATERTKKPDGTSMGTRTPGKIAPDVAKKAQRESRVRAAREKLDDSLAAFAAAQQEAERTAETLAEARQRAAVTARAASRAEKEARAASQRSVAAQEAETAAADSAKATNSAARKAGTAVKAARRRLDRLDRLEKTGG